MNSSFHSSIKLLDSIPALVWQAGTDAKWTFFNKYWLHYTGRTLDEELGHGWVEGVHPGDRNVLVKTYLEHFDAGDPFSMEIRLRHRDGSYRWIIIHGEPINSSGGAFMGYLGFGHDITEQKRFTENLRESRQRFQSLANMSPVGIFRIAPDGSCHYVSDRWCQIAGITQDKAMGSGWLKALHPDDRASTESQLRACLNNMSDLDVECRFLHEDESVNWVMVQLRPELDEHGILDGYFGSIIDLTQGRHLSEEQLKISKFESLGILAGGIAHDFNNLLTPILLNLSITKSQLGDSPDLAELKERIVEAEQASMRARGLTQQLLTFAEGGHPVMKPVFLSELLRESVRFALHGSRIQSELSISDDLLPVKVDVGQFNQVIQNLVINSMQAMESGGSLRVVARNLDELNHPGIPKTQGDHVSIRIEDEGVGISPENLAKIFDPYYSTRANGNGLGLSTALSIVRKHSGHIGVESEPGLGTAFTIYLPATSESVETIPPLDLKEMSGKAHVLVMDDEELVLSSMRALLTTLGYKVDTATDGKQALNIYRICKENGDPIDVALMDLTIQGGMGGKETVEKLRTFDPEARAVVCSGYSNDPIMANFEDYGFYGAIQKPFQPEELQALLSKVVRS